MEHSRCHQTVRCKSCRLVTAPKMPPSVFTISSADRCRCFSEAAQQSSRSKHSNPRSFASRKVVWTQTSVVTPHRIKFLMPLMRSMSSKSVDAKAPFPGLSMMGSSSLGRSSGMTSWPGSPRTSNRPRGPRSPIPIPEGLLRER